MENNLTYQQNGDYQIPNLTLKSDSLPDQVGKYGMLRQTYLREHRKGAYTRMKMQDTLWDHIVEIDQTAHKVADRLMDEMMKSQNVTEELKAQDQMLWVQKVGNIKAQAEEIVLKELIYN